MGKKILVFLSLFVVPTFCWAFGDDSCTNPKEYTIDKRCYVTDEQKSQKPYNAIVSLKKGFCTGTIVNINDVAYVYTAKHCVDNDGDNEPDDKIVVKLQNGLNFYAYKDNVGDYMFETHGSRSGDWAIYRMKKSVKELPFVNIRHNGGNYHARLVGYGTLKVLSDLEIAEFRRLYLEYLDAVVGPDRYASYKYGYSLFNPGVDAKNEYVKQFINDMDQETAARFFKDNKRLKESSCYYNNGKEVNCQTWGGGSGSGIFDDDDIIRGVHTTGTKIIGGKKHALGVDSVRL